jgi:phosphate butyryltransferase
MEALALAGEKQTVALAAADSQEALLAVDHARRKGIIKAILVGDAARVGEICAAGDIDLSAYELEDVPEPQKAAARAVAVVREGRAGMLMKGLVETGDFLRAVMDKENGLRGGRRMCSVALMECQAKKKLLVLADVGTNIAPGVDEKADIIASCAEVAKAIGLERPKAAVLCAQEKVRPESMPATVEASILAKMSERGQIPGGAIVEGPISMDIAVDEHASRVKKFGGQIQGDADILIAPDLSAGNILIKGLMYLTDNVRVAGVGMGARVPLILTSRGDDQATKYYSIVLASLISRRSR